MVVGGGAALQGSEPRLRTRDWIALALLMFGPFVLMIGWFVGVWLLWASNRWSMVWKIVGTAAWPIGWVAAASAEFFQPPLWVSLLVAGVIESAVYLALIVEARV
ncbi:hypothetical protein GCM10009789_41480 [Kribbella sancticallisti]|uniref:Uncharacterized protein n=1 Tax=Kribbella sancticallisti TaxID=460087 RepID=A0ABP4PKC3_9ACTN